MDKLKMYSNSGKYNVAFHKSKRKSTDIWFCLETLY